MSLFEKIEPESIDPTEPVDELPAPRSTKHGKDQPLVVGYRWYIKVLLVLFSLVFIPLLQFFLEDGFLFLELLLVVGVAMGVWYLGDCLLTQEFILSPAGVEKKGFLSHTFVPAEALVMAVGEQDIRFFHGSEKNLRESVRIRRFMLDETTVNDIQDYARAVYQIRHRAGTAAITKGKPFKNKYILAEYEKAVYSYQTVGAFFVVTGVVAVFTAGLNDNFHGLMPELPSFAVRLACIALVVAIYVLMGKLSRNMQIVGRDTLVPLEMRMKQLENGPFYTALVVNGVALLGLLLFLLFGNMFDFYLFMFIAILYFFDFYPRLSVWQGSAAGSSVQDSASEAGVTICRRSLHVSLVLMGALAMVSQGESQRYLYANRQDCINDWGEGKDCEEVPSTSGHYGSSHYYGPRYGSGGGRPTRSVGVTTVSRGGFGSLGSFHASFGG